MLSLFPGAQILDAIDKYVPMLDKKDRAPAASLHLQKLITDMTEKGSLESLVKELIKSNAKSLLVTRKETAKLLKLVVEKKPQIISDATVNNVTSWFCDRCADKDGKSTLRIPAPEPIVTLLRFLIS